MRDSDTEEHQEADDQRQRSVLCDAEVQVTPDRKNARVQTSTKMKTISKHIHQVSSATSDHGI